MSGQRQPISEYTETFHTFEAGPQDVVPPGEMRTYKDENGAVVAVDFRCPCGCGSGCYTPVTDATKGQPKRERHWLYSRGPNGPTLSPSIRYTGGCKAHFNVTDGKAVMHGDSGR